MKPLNKNMAKITDKPKDTAATGFGETEAIKRYMDVDV